MNTLFIIHGTEKHTFVPKILAVYEDEEVAKIVYMFLTMDKSMADKYLCLALSYSGLIIDEEDLEESLREDLKKYR